MTFDEALVLAASIILLISIVVVLFAIFIEAYGFIAVSIVAVALLIWFGLAGLIYWIDHEW